MLRIDEVSDNMRNRINPVMLRLGRENIQFHDHRAYNHHHFPYGTILRCICIYKHDYLNKETVQRSLLFGNPYS